MMFLAIKVTRISWSCDFSNAGGGLWCSDYNKLWHPEIVNKLSMLKKILWPAVTTSYGVFWLQNFVLCSKPGEFGQITSICLICFLRGATNWREIAMISIISSVPTLTLTQNYTFLSWLHQTFLWYPTDLSVYLQMSWII